MSEKQKFFVLAPITSLPLSLNVHLFMCCMCRWNPHSCLSTFIILNTFVWSVSCPFLFFFSQNTIFLLFFNLSSFRNASSCQITLIAHCWGLAIFWKWAKCTTWGRTIDLYYFEYYYGCLWHHCSAMLYNSLSRNLGFW